MDEAREYLKLGEKLSNLSEEERKIIHEQIEQRIKERQERKENKQMEQPVQEKE